MHNNKHCKNNSRDNKRGTLRGGRQECISLRTQDWRSDTSVRVSYVLPTYKRGDPGSAFSDLSLATEGSLDRLMSPLCWTGVHLYHHMSPANRVDQKSNYILRGQGSFLLPWGAWDSPPPPPRDTVQLEGTEKGNTPKEESIITNWIHFADNNEKENQKEVIFLKAFTLPSDTRRSCQAWTKSTQP